MQNAVKNVHDPCFIFHDGYYYVYSTGHGIPIRRSRDREQWEMVGRVFAEDIPAWAKMEIPGSVFPWAPDIAYFNGRYHLYYSVSTFGKNRSLIGLVTNKTLDPKHPEYAWKDEGKVVESFPQNDYNAIDPNVLPLDRNRLILTFGSFWSGIKMVECEQKSGKPKPAADVRAIAQRPAPDALEAPFLIRNGDYYYLFVSFDFCCRGTRSTYNTRVGRSKTVEGPYVDREGVALMAGGGSPLLTTEGRYIGPGHCAVLKKGREHFIAHHFYDAEDNGIPTLRVRPLSWDKDGWPVAK